MHPAERRALLGAGFRERFQRSPSLWVRAPGRVDAMGSHTDYNGGFVLTVPIDRDTWIAAAPRNDGVVRMASLNVDDEAQFSVDDLPQKPLPGWTVYVQGVARAFAEEGLALNGCDLLVHGTLPIGSGLSSSASLEAATAVLLANLGNYAVDGVHMAQLCQRAENETVGVGCGILDQYSVILGEEGSMLLLDCGRLSHSYAPIPAGLQPVICNTRAHRQLSGSEYGERRSDCETGARLLGEHLSNVSCLRDVSRAQFDDLEATLPERVARRCRFVIEENERVLRMAEALAAADQEAIGHLCDESFAGARDLFEITIPAMESMYQAAAGTSGAIAVRQAGAGFGGCMLALVEAEQVTNFIDRAGAAYSQATGVVPELYPVRPAPGAGLLAED